MDDFIIHGCEQVLRFTQVERWDNLSESLKVQLSFNMGVVALGLKLTKEEGFQALINAKEGRISMQEFRDHLKSLLVSHRVEVNNETKFACFHGPDFDGHQVDWDLLFARQKTYLDEEKKSLEQWQAGQSQHQCQCKHS